jgi:hypothetical protein
MRVVLYADDMEPITVLELPQFAHRYLEDRGVVRLPVPPLINHSSVSNCDLFLRQEFKTVDIYAEKVIRHGRPHLMLFTHDEENSLLLKAAFLPGQNSFVQQLQRNAFASGFLDALSNVGR